MDLFFCKNFVLCSPSYFFLICNFITLSISSDLSISLYQSQPLGTSLSNSVFLSFSITHFCYLCLYDYSPCFLFKLMLYSFFLLSSISLSLSHLYLSLSLSPFYCLLFGLCRITLIILCFFGLISFSVFFSSFALLAPIRTNGCERPREEAKENPTRTDPESNDKFQQFFGTFFLFQL